MKFIGSIDTGRLKPTFPAHHRKKPLQKCTGTRVFRLEQVLLSLFLMDFTFILHRLLKHFSRTTALRARIAFITIDTPDQSAFRAFSERGIAFFTDCHLPSFCKVNRKLYVVKKSRQNCPNLSLRFYIGPGCCFG